MHMALPSLGSDIASYGGDYTSMGVNVPTNQTFAGGHAHAHASMGAMNPGPEHHHNHYSTSSSMAVVPVPVPVSAAPNPEFGGNPHASNSEDVADTIVRARKSWKTVKGRSEPVWPPNLEKALVQGESLGPVGPECTMFFFGCWC